MTELSKSARRFQRYLEQRQRPLEVIELPASTCSAADAAVAFDCDQAQIVKSLVFRAVDTDVPVIVLASGVTASMNPLSPMRLASASTSRTPNSSSSAPGSLSAASSPSATANPARCSSTATCLHTKCSGRPPERRTPCSGSDRPITDILGDHRLVSFA